MLFKTCVRIVHNDDEAVSVKKLSCMQSMIKASAEWYVHLLASDQPESVALLTQYTIAPKVC